MKYTNYKELEGIIFNYPELMAEDAEQQVKDLFVKMQITRNLLAEANKVSDGLRAQIKELEKEWQVITSLASFAYKTDEKEEINNKVNWGFNFSADINKNIH